MRSNMLMVSALVLGAFTAVSTVAYAAVPASPFPNTGKTTKLAAVPASPFPNTGKTTKLA